MSDIRGISLNISDAIFKGFLYFDRKKQNTPNSASGDHGNHFVLITGPKASFWNIIFQGFKMF